ncbi:hypothetical protein ACJ73_01733 [Blastomyces percursus]|uniref:Major facilitator superfamily (MFS) profile domain-containing protein n=1 Tax=Blastomyces percursus TaxID=1658174 RepID=A0A1J9QDI8_9EURO|nr:hypothetical protein ACJ73_01733 [Blastomyces percursus]
MSILGSLNGVATTASAVGKAMGPAILGGTFSLGVKKGYMILPWWTLAFIASLSALPVFWCKENDQFSESADTDGNDNGLVNANGNEVERGEASLYQEDTDGETRGWGERENLNKGNAGGIGFVRSDKQHHKTGPGGRRACENRQEDD